MSSLLQCHGHQTWQSRVVTYGRKTPTTKSRDLLIMWLRDKCKSLYLQFCITGITSKLGRVKSLDLLITWSREKLKNLYLHFNSTCGSQTWEGSDLGWGTPSTKSRERLIKCSRGHYTLDIFKTSVAILLTKLSLLN